MLIASTALPAKAAEFLTSGSGLFYYDNPNNWFGNTVPGPTENITFQQFPVGGARQVLWGTGTGNTISSDLRVLNSLYVFTATQGTDPEHRVNGSTTIRNDGELRLGNPNEDVELVTSTLDVQDGGTLVVRHGSDVTADRVFLAEAVGAPAAITVDGVGSSLQLNNGTSLIGRNGSTGTLSLINGSTATIADLGLADSAVDNSSANLSVTGGSVLTLTDELRAGTGSAPGQVTTIDVIGANSAINQTGVTNMVIGAAGASSTATVNIGSGGEVSSGLAGFQVRETGTVNVNAGGTLRVNQWTYVSGGAMNVLNGGTIINAGRANIGFEAGSNGFATVTGNNSSWDTTFDGVDVGTHGTGTLRIESGGLVDTVFGVLGHFIGSAGTAILSGAGSRWIDNSLGLAVGESGEGTLQVFRGGFVESGSGVVASNDDSTGTVLVTGDDPTTGDPSTWQVAGNLNIGSGGEGTLLIEDGGRVENAGRASIGSDAGSNGFATVAGNGSSWDTTSEGIDVGTSGEGTLRIEAGGHVDTVFGVLGRSADSTGTVVVTGTGSRWVDSLGLNVGVSGEGTLQVTAGGFVESGSGVVANNAGATGTAIITGDNSAWVVDGNLNIGGGGEGTLSIDGGGRVDSGARVAVGLEASSNGSVHVVGQGSSLDANQLDIGAVGTGLVNLENEASATVQTTTTVGPSGTLRFDGGTLVSRSFKRDSGVLETVQGQLVVDRGTFDLEAATTEFNLDSTSGDFEIVLENGARATTGQVRLRRATITVDGPGTRWISSSSFGVGRQSNVGEDFAANLNILNGGVVQGTGTLFANEVNSRGNVVIDGNDSEWIITGGGQFLLANQGGSIANLDITNGGALTSNSNVEVARDNNSTAEISIRGAGSNWTNTGDILLGINGQATLTLEDSGLVNLTGELTVGQRGRIEGDGAINAAGGVVADGVVAPGQSVGTLTIDGDFRQQAVGTLEVELGGTAPGASDLLNVTGSSDINIVDFRGTLELSLLPSYMPSVGDRIVFVQYPTITNGFGEILQPEGLPNELAFEVTYFPTFAQLTLAPALDGDFNADGTVDAADYTVWRDSVGSTSDLAADANRDLVVNEADYDIWVSNFGASLPSATSAVPEPTAAGLLLVLAAIGTAGRRR